MWKKYGSYDVISTYIYILCCSFSILCNNSNCLRQIIKKAQLSPIGEKVGTLSPFCRVLGIFLLNAQLGTGTSYACEMSIFKGTVSRFSACASDDLSTVKVIVFRPIRSAFTTLAGYGGKLLQLVVDSI